MVYIYLFIPFAVSEKRFLDLLYLFSKYRNRTFCNIISFDDRIDISENSSKHFILMVANWYNNKCQVWIALEKSKKVSHQYIPCAFINELWMVVFGSSYQGHSSSPTFILSSLGVVTRLGENIFILGILSPASAPRMGMRIYNHLNWSLWGLAK